jgi:hypothetical protein
MTKPKFTAEFSYEVRLAVSLPRAWTTFLKRVASGHYDYKCREAGECGVINGLNNTTCDGEFPSSFRVTWRELDLITKVMEQARYHRDGDKADVAPAIHQWLRETKIAIEERHAAIEACFDPAPIVIATEQQPLEPHDVASWAAFLSTVRVGGGLPLTFRPDDTHVVVEMIVPYVPPEPQPLADPTKVPLAIAAGFPVPFSVRYRLPAYSPDNAPHFIRQIVRDIYHHEIDEQFHVDGSRPFAPEH